MPQSLFASHRLRALTLLSLTAMATSTRAQQQPTSRAARAQQFVAQRASSKPTASPAASLLAARQQSAALQQVTSLNTAWQPLGPSSIFSATFGNLTGRVTALAADPNDATGNTLYVGTTGGGVWKSTHAAGALATATFVPLTDAQPSLSIGALAVQPLGNPILLAGTGDPNDATDSYYGLGILRSADGGATWSLIPGSHDGVNGNHSFAGLSTAALVFSTATPTLAVAALSTSPQAAVVSATNTTSVPGLYFSTDAGLTWQMATLYDGATVVQQPQPLGTGQVGNAATSVVWDAQRQRFYAAVRGHGYYSSPDGATWTRLLAQPGTALTAANCPVGVNGLGASSCPISRGVLAAQPATGDLYALTVDAADNDQGLWQDLCLAASGTCSTTAPTFATRLDNGALDTTGTTQIAQGGYNLTLAAAPAAANGTLLFAGTIDLYRCALSANSSLCTLRDTTNALDGCNAPAGVAPAQHALAVIALGTPLLYLGNDGGLWRSLDGVAETGSVCAATDITHFDNLNQAFSGSLAEVVSFAQHPTDANTLLAGLGAIGSTATSTASSQSAWPQLSDGEGGTALLDPATPTNWTLTIGAGVNLAQCTLGSACAAANFAPPATIGAPQVDYDASLLDAPSLLDPALTTNLLVATCRVWRGPAASGLTWSTSNAISPAFNASGAPNNNAIPCTTSSPLIRSLAVGGPASTTTIPQLSGSAVLYAGLSGALDGGGTLAGHLFVTTTANTAPTSSSWLDAALSPVTNDVSNANLFNPAAFDVSTLAVDPHDPTGATVYATVMGFGYPHVYRSVDFGAHWLNLSANLPDAPANALVVDPNDANTVYVALDTGVYVTQQITNCPATNCWSVLGASLPNAPVLSLQAAAAMPTGTGLLGMLRAGTYGRGLWQLPLLTAHSPSLPALTLSATSFAFPGTQVSTQSPTQTLTVTSSGTAPASITTLAITGDFTEIDTCAGQILPVGAQCAVTITFAPSATGPRTGQLTLYANIATGQAAVALSGNGITAPSVLFTPTALTFAAAVVNQSDPVQYINIANTGGTTATLQTPVVLGDTADFAITANTCAATLPPGTACAVAITFTPSATGTRSATLSLTDSAGTAFSETQTASLTGVGNAPATDTLSATALTFAPQQLNTTSPAQQVTLTNSGGVALTLIAASVSPGDFTVVNRCGNSLAANSSCALSVTFTPTAVGTRTAALTVADQFHAQTITLTGTGVAPPGISLTPVALAFAATGVTLVSQPQTLTLTNNGGLPLSISSMTISPGFTVAATTCAASLAPAAACGYTIVFAPAAAGPLTGALTLTTNAATATQSVALTGTGIDFTLAPTGPISATLTASASAVYSLQLSSIPGIAGNVALSCMGAPANSTCNIAPPSAALGTATPITVTVATATSVAQLAPASRALYLALLLPLALFVRRRRPLTLCALLAACVLAGLTGCGANRIIPATTGGSGSGSGSSNPTPPGTYTLTISATADGLTHTVPLTLIVQ